SPPHVRKSCTIPPHHSVEEPAMSPPVRRSSRLFGRFVLFALLLAGGGGLAAVAQAPLPPRAHLKPGPQDTGDFPKRFTYSLSVDPHWIGKSDIFWYEYRTNAGKQWYRVNARVPSKEPLFDRAKVAGLLSEQVRKPLDPLQLPITRATLEDDGVKF